MKRLMLCVIIAALLSGCTALRFGFGLPIVDGKIQIVNQETKGVGYERIMLVKNQFPPLRGFIKEHGLPESFREFMYPRESRYELAMFYPEEKRTYTFRQADMSVASLYLSSVLEGREW